jgi:arylsulfatase A-like enzyme
MKPTLPLLTALLFAPLAALHAAETKPNIIVILADDLGYADLGCQGSKEVLSPQIDSIADHLKAAGYVTGIVGKWHLGDSEKLRPYYRGFDESFWHPNGGVLFPDKKTGAIQNLYRGCDPVRVAEYSTDAFGREAVEFIGRHQRESFFLYLSFVPPHCFRRVQDDPRQLDPDGMQK